MFNAISLEFFLNIIFAIRGLGVGMNIKRGQIKCVLLMCVPYIIGKCRYLKKYNFASKKEFLTFEIQP